VASQELGVGFCERRHNVAISEVESSIARLNIFPLIPISFPLIYHPRITNLLSIPWCKLSKIASIGKGRNIGGIRQFTVICRCAEVFQSLTSFVNDDPASRMELLTAAIASVLSCAYVTGNRNGITRVAGNMVAIQKRV